MKQIKSPRPVRHLQPLETGQLWRMAGADLRVGIVGKLLVHYKLGKPDGVRVPNSCSGKKTVEKYLKAKKAVLAVALPSAKPGCGPGVRRAGLK